MGLQDSCIGQYIVFTIKIWGANLPIASEAYFPHSSQKNNYFLSSIKAQEQEQLLLRVVQKNQLEAFLDAMQVSE